MSEKKQSTSSNEFYSLFYRLTRNIFLAYAIVVVLGVIAVAGYGYAMHAYYEDSELWEYLGSLLS